MICLIWALNAPIVVMLGIQRIRFVLRQKISNIVERILELEQKEATSKSKHKYNSK
jgi:hypothetical protein